MKTKKAFTLVEIIISTIILTGGVFSIYKLLTINTNNLNNYDNLEQTRNIFTNMQECIKSIGFDNLTGSTNYSFNFGTNNSGCFTGTYDNSLNFSGVTIDNKEYFLYGSGIKSSDKIDFELFVKESSLSTQNEKFILYK